jgi:hypothetical protein
MIASFQMALNCTGYSWIASFYLQIRDFGIAEREEDIGYYAGYVGELPFQYLLLTCVGKSSYKLLMKWSWRILLCMSKGSSFMIGRALTSVFWGIVADRYGRKPVILLGTIAVWVISTFQVHVLAIKVGFLCSKNIVFTLSWLSWLWVGLRVIFNTLFGLSVNFWMAIITRFLLGSLNGLLGPIKVGFCTIFIKISLG